MGGALFGDEAGKRVAGGDGKALDSAGIQREWRSGRERDPADLIGLAAQHLEEAVVTGQDLADGICGVDGERLRFAKKEKTERGIHFGRGENQTSDGRMAELRRVGVKRRETFNLITKVGAGVDEIPMMAAG